MLSTQDRVEALKLFGQIGEAVEASLKNKAYDKAVGKKHVVLFRQELGDYCIDVAHKRQEIVEIVSSFLGDWWATGWVTSNHLRIYL